jgi:hypothetical protein
MPVAASGVDSRLGAGAAGAATEASALSSLPSHSFLTVPKILRIAQHFCCHSSPPAPSFLLRRTARVLAVSAVSAALALASSTPPRSCLPTWSTRALSTTATARDALAPEPDSAAAPASTPSPPLTPAPPPKPKPELKHPSPAELQTRYGHSSDTLHALLAHPAHLAPLQRPRFPIVLCHGESYGPCHPCAELSAQGLCRAVWIRRARAGRVPEDAGHYWKNVLEILRNTVVAEVFVTSVPPCVSPLSFMSPTLMTCPQDGVNRRARA